MARPSKYKPETGDRICQMLAGGQSASKACKSVGVSLMSMYRWLREHEEFRDNYARAREDQADTFADEMCDIADEEEDVQRAKLKIDARKWVAARMKPKSWGDRSAIEHSGPNGGPIESKDVTERDAEEFASRIAGLAAAGSAGSGTTEADD